MEKKYGKKYDSFIKKTKSYFFDDNDKLLENNRRIVELYLAQPIRNNCKMCGDRLDEECLSLISHGVKYILCKKCNHLNGSHIETAAFSPCKIPAPAALPGHSTKSQYTTFHFLP